MLQFFLQRDRLRIRVLILYFTIYKRQRRSLLQRQAIEIAILFYILQKQLAITQETWANWIEYQEQYIKIQKNWIEVQRWKRKTIKSKILYTIAINWENYLFLYKLRITRLES